jgi:hypothetical protein
LFPAFKRAAEEFAANLQNGTITLNNIDKYIRSVVVEGSDARQLILRELELIRQITTFTNPDQDTCITNICTYLKFVDSREVIAGLLSCAKYFLAFSLHPTPFTHPQSIRSLKITLDPQYHSFELLVNQSQKMHTLADFVTSSEVLQSTGGYHITLPAPHLLPFIREFSLCQELIEWMTTFLKNDDLRHEVDILKSKMMGDKQFVAVLGDLDAVRGWLQQLGIARPQSTTSRYLLPQFS